MKDLIRCCKKYLMDTLGVDVDLTVLSKTGSLPFFLHDQYEFHTLKMFADNFVVLMAKNETESTPATLRKHVDLVRGKLKTKTIFLGAAITSFNRKRLIEYKVPFIIPQNQMYLPDLAIDLREHFIRLRSKPLNLRPAAQAVMLFILLQKITGPVTPKYLAEKLGYSKMSISRAVAEIKNTKLAQVETKGRQRLVHFDRDRRKLWQESLTYLKTPVNKVVWLTLPKKPPCFYESGLSALSRYSMLSPPKQAEYAVGASQWRKIKGDLQISKFTDEADCKLEIWNYAPDMLTKYDDRKVDPFSLHLSLKDTEDERILAAIEQMMESIKW